MVMNIISLMRHVRIAIDLKLRDISRKGRPMVTLIVYIFTDRPIIYMLAKFSFLCIIVNIYIVQRKLNMTLEGLSIC